MSASQIRKWNLKKFEPCSQNPGFKSVRYEISMKVQPSPGIMFFILCHSDPSTQASVGFYDHLEDRQEVEPVRMSLSWPSEAKEKPSPRKHSPFRL